MHIDTYKNESAQIWSGRSLIEESMTQDDYNMPKNIETQMMRLTTEDECSPTLNRAMPSPQNAQGKLSYEKSVDQYLKAFEQPDIS